MRACMQMAACTAAGALWHCKLIASRCHHSPAHAHHVRKFAACASPQSPAAALPDCCQADFSYYFDSGSRRRCYLAPERFFEGSPAAINAAAPLTPDMVRRAAAVGRAAAIALDAHTHYHAGRQRTRQASQHTPNTPVPRRTSSRSAASLLSCGWTEPPFLICPACWPTGAASTTRRRRLQAWRATSPSS